jgi:hypothetical protein
MGGNRLLVCLPLTGIAPLGEGVRGNSTVSPNLADSMALPQREHRSFCASTNLPRSGSRRGAPGATDIGPEPINFGLTDPSRAKSAAKNSGISLQNGVTEITKLEEDAMNAKLVITCLVCGMLLGPAGAPRGMRGAPGDSREAVVSEKVDETAGLQDPA